MREHQLNYNLHHNPPEDDIYDITFIGAGPSALFGAFYAGMRQMSCKILDSQEHAGGQLTALYPEKWIYDAPGYPKILAKDLANRLLEQANHWNPKICLNERINSLKIDGIGNPLILESDKGIHKTKTLVIAAGQGSMTPNKLQNEKLNQKLSKFENKNIFFTLRNKNRYLQKRVLIAGGGDSAMDGALNLKDYASKITLVHRSDNYKAMPSTVAEIIHESTPTQERPEPSIDFKPFHELKDVFGDSKLEGAVIFNNKTKEETKIDLDYILLLLGFKPDPNNPIRNWGLEFADEEKKQIKVNMRQETNLPGVYAIGDIAKVDLRERIKSLILECPGLIKELEDQDPLPKYKDLFDWIAGDLATQQFEVANLGLIASGYGQAPVAVGYAYQFIHPGASVKPGHSSNLKL